MAMEKRSLDFLRTILETPSPSGFEQPVQKLVRERLKEYCDEVRTDVHGNVIGVRNPKAKMRVMLAGHVDEIGFMIQSISDDGFLRFAGIGGIDPQIPVGQRVQIHSEKGPVSGVIGKKAIHLMDAEERGKSLKLHELWIDIGAKNRKEVEKCVQIGDPVTLDVKFLPLKNNLVAARGMDDRVGTFTVIETLRLVAKKKLNVAVYGVSTVQEELGLRGARTSAFGIDPHVGIAIDVGQASDHPTVDKGRFGDVKLGKGPMLHRGANINPVLGQMLVRTAQKAKIPYQFTGAPTATGTDANAMQIARAGAATALLSIPNRYMHTPVEIISLKDLENAAKLLAHFLSHLPAKVDFTP